MMGPIERQQANAIIAEIKAAVAPICEKHQLTLAHNSGRYDEVSMRVTLELQCVDASGVNAAEKANWDACCRFFDLKPQDYGIVIPQVGGRGQYKLVAIEPKRPRYPFVGEDTRTHKRYKLPSPWVRGRMERGRHDEAEAYAVAVAVAGTARLGGRLRRVGQGWL
jgi:hypothetical protein